MNKIHFTTIQNIVGEETTQKLRMLSDFYNQTKVSNYYNKTSTLLEVGKRINQNNAAELMVCPHFGAETIRGSFARDTKLVIHDKIPKRFQGFLESGLFDVLNEMRMNTRIIISTKEFFEVNDPISFSHIRKLIEPSRELIQTLCPSSEVSLLSQPESENYRDHFMPLDHLDCKWPEDFRISQSRHALSLTQKRNTISIQSEMLQYPLGRSFYKATFEKSPLAIIGYRVPKSY